MNEDLLVLKESEETKDFQGKEARKVQIQNIVHSLIRLRSMVLVWNLDFVIAASVEVPLTFTNFL